MDMTVELNRPLPDFELVGLDGNIQRLSNLRGKIVAVTFWSADCPHVERTDASMLAAQARWSADVVLLFIASNANESAAELENAARRLGPFNVLKDSDHNVADQFEAQVTPEVYVADREGILRYRGAVDDVSLRQRMPTRSYFENAVDSLLAGDAPDVAEIPAFGCALVRYV